MFEFENIGLIHASALTGAGTGRWWGDEKTDRREKNVLRIFFGRVGYGFCNPNQRRQTQNIF
ncbi:MAG: hypothetical protein MPEBLZ_03226 [Candidatus Methanoperedens nitroreducens]|uniref:Uncharacterized protein n=1 Tax=Candidatus Methanoperedens nitratireducens TaxID=1392998 RepID=A0A0P8ADI6_9EURY|nr:MAG: hypothetical protein MPEBLZ_03226 [Candidatus Methanoperedens sp. BLZ1]